MNGIEIAALASRWVHLLSVVVAIGGAVFMRVALMPAARETLSDDVHAKLRAGLMMRWKKVVHACVGLLILSGGYNFYMAFYDDVKPLPYHPIFGVKLILALIVFFFAIALTGSSPGFTKLRENNRKWLGVQIALAVVVIILSGVLKTIHQAAIAAPTG